MHFEFTEDQRLLQQTVRDFLAGECPVSFVRGQWETPTGRSPEFWKKLAEIGVVATWSWWWVTSPLWIPFAFAGAMLIARAVFDRE